MANEGNWLKRHALDAWGELQPSTAWVHHAPKRFFLCLAIRVGSDEAPAWQEAGIESVRIELAYLERKPKAALDQIDRR